MGFYESTGISSFVECLVSVCLFVVESIVFSTKKTFFSKKETFLLVAFHYICTFASDYLGYCRQIGNMQSDNTLFP